MKRKRRNPAAVALGRLGGRASAKVQTRAKARAARINGAKGGRPRSPRCVNCGRTHSQHTHTVRDRCPTYVEPTEASR